MRVSGADFATETVWDMLGVPSPGSDEVPPPSPLAPQHLPTTRVKSRHLCVCVRETERVSALSFCPSSFPKPVSHFGSSSEGSAISLGDRDRL